MYKKIIITIIVITIIIIWGVYFYLSLKSVESPISIPQIEENVNLKVNIATTTTDKALSSSTDQVGAKIYQVSIADFSFNPNTVIIKKGDSILWTNNDSAPHQISGTNINSSIMSKGQTYSQTFTEVGTFNYHCTIHPAMKAVIVVI